ncbi:uncharacterized protein LOC117282505 [Cryptotermes secundus]|uniref:uncharacterized protein LOC117282505 n=1 Tax=Cryptotermes secundus TaxID=105785 RepID=UPI001454C0E7|nr:uncharacterized protein LOC117282505 [Cryptotermes secundus]
MFPEISHTQALLGALWYAVDVTEDTHSDVLKAARSLFCKRTRTLYRWVYPNISKYELNRRVADAWDSASQDEKNIYISEVLGRFGTRNRTVILNPRLEEILSMPASLLENRSIVTSLNCSIGQALQAVDALRTSNEDAATRTSDYTLKREYTKRGSRKKGNTNVRTRKAERKPQRSKKRKLPSSAETDGTAKCGALITDEFAEEADILKYKWPSDPALEFGDGSELNSELENPSLLGDQPFLMNLLNLEAMLPLDM